MGVFILLYVASGREAIAQAFLECLFAEVKRKYEPFRKQIFQKCRLQPCIFFSTMLFLPHTASVADLSAMSNQPGEYKT